MPFQNKGWKRKQRVETLQLNPCYCFAANAARDPPAGWAPRSCPYSKTYRALVAVRQRVGRGGVRKGFVLRGLTCVRQMFYGRKTGVFRLLVTGILDLGIVR